MATWFFNEKGKYNMDHSEINIYKSKKKDGHSLESSLFDKLTEEIIEFRGERNWRRFHNPKELAISLSLEASELLENFQWKSSKEAINENLENIINEIADVVIYAI